MISYPKELDTIFSTLISHNIKPIIVGGFIRDSLLNLHSKDIDVEVYNLDSYEKLEEILSAFGDINSVGKSFGVCKFRYENIEIDFSLPREESKVSKGHKGFITKTDSNLDFKSASKRRDFTINSMGYDVQKRELLDPYNGLKDLKEKRLRAVNSTTFVEDPLRVLRAVRFSTRFNFKLDTQLFKLCFEMIEQNMLEELPKERVFGEIEKIALKSSKPSYAVILLKRLNAQHYFKEFKNLTYNEFIKTLKAIDKMASLKSSQTQSDITVMFCALTSQLNSSQRVNFLNNITQEKKILKRVESLLQKSISKSPTDEELYILARDIKIFELLKLSLALNKIDIINYNIIKKRAIALNIYSEKLPSLIQGRDLIELGFKPSKEFSNYIESAYRAQMKGEFKNYKEAKEWLNNLLS